MPREVKIKITADARQGRISVQEMGREINTLGDRTVKNERRISAAFKNLSGAAQVFLGDLAARAAQSLLGSIRNLAVNGFQLLNESVQLAGIQQIAERKLDQALLNLGDTSEESRKKLKDMASEVQSFSNFGDESLITAQAMLLSFREVAGADGAELLTSRLADVAAGLANAEGGTVDLNSVAGLMGRALSQGASALREAKVSLDAETEAAFNAATGMERVSMLAEILDTNFKGLARATANPLVQLKNSIGDVKEELGKGLLPVVEEFARELTAGADSEQVKTLAHEIGSKLGEALRKVVSLVKDNKDEIIDFWISSVEGAKDLATEISAIHDALKPITSTTQSVENEFDGWWAWADNFKVIGAAVQLMTGNFKGASETLAYTALNLKVTDIQSQLAGRGLANLGLIQELGSERAKRLREESEHLAAALALLPKESENPPPPPPPPPPDLSQFEQQARATFDFIGTLGPELERSLSAALANAQNTTKETNRIFDDALADEQARINARMEARAQEVAEDAAGKAQQADGEAALAKAAREAAEQRVKSAAMGSAASAKNEKDVGNAVRQIMKAYLAEAIAGAAAKMLASVPFPFNVAAAAAAVGAASIAFEELVPSFDKGIENFKGGLAKVHGDEVLVNLAPGTSVIPAEDSRQIVRQAMSFDDGRIVGALERLGAKIDSQTDRLEAVERTIALDPFRFLADMDRVRMHQERNLGRG